jgi:hypothetical protein
MLGVFTRASEHRKENSTENKDDTYNKQQFPGGETASGRS